jgi:hypothetical protein
MGIGCLKIVTAVGIFAYLSFAEDNKNSLTGTWTGTIGKAKINVCFQGDDASYYYLKYLQPIRLEKVDSKRWKENDSCELVIETITNTSAKGKWVNQKKNASLPINLSLLESYTEGEENSESPCGCDQFNNPMEKLPPLTIDTVKEANHLTYKTYSLESGSLSMSWFELLGGNAAVKQINQVIGKGYPPDAKEFYSCRRGTLTSFGSADAEYSSTIVPYLWTSCFLVVSISESGFCGGAHPFSGVAYKTFDLTSGKEVSVSSWVQNIEDNEEFRSLILSQNPRDTTDPDNKECNDMILENTSFSIRLDTTGLVFYTEFAHCCQACDEEFLVPFQELTPFLTEEGKGAMKYFRKQGRNGK